MMGRLLSADIFPVHAAGIEVLRRFQPELIIALAGAAQPPFRGRFANKHLASDGRPGDMAARVLQILSDSNSNPVKRIARWGSWEIPLLAGFRYRGLELLASPCVSVVASHWSAFRAEQNVGAIPAIAQRPEQLGKTFGLQVTTLTFTGRRGKGTLLSYVGRLGEDGNRDRLLKLTQNATSQAAIARASPDEALYVVQSHHDRSQFTFLASRLQPSLIGTSGIAWGRVTGWGDPSAVVREAIIQPGARRKLIDDELQRIAGTSQCTHDIMCGLFPNGLDRIDSSRETIGNNFMIFKEPKAIVGGGVKVKASGKPLWDGMLRNGLYKYDPALRNVAVRGYILSSAPTPAEFEQAEETFGELIGLLTKLGLSIAVSPVQAVTCAKEAATKAHAEGVQAIVFFETSRTPSSYHIAKWECLSRPAPHLLHIASQWLTLTKAKHDFYALASVALGLCGKIGHTSYIVDVQRDVALDHDLVVGADVCHYRHETDTMRHIVAAWLCRMHGQSESLWLYNGSIAGESIPSNVWRTVITPEACSGKNLSIHRDGRFTDVELDFLKQHAKDVAVNGGCFTLIEVVKYAGGSPRLYLHTNLTSVAENAPNGAFLKLSESECILVTGDSHLSGTRNPLLIRVIAQPGKPNVESVARDVFHLTMVNHGNMWSKSRLPITTRVADSAAYFYANCPVEESAPMRYCGSQQFWL